MVVLAVEVVGRREMPAGLAPLPMQVPLASGLRRVVLGNTAAMTARILVLGSSAIARPQRVNPVSAHAVRISGLPVWMSAARQAQRALRGKRQAWLVKQERLGLTKQPSRVSR